MIPLVDLKAQYLTIKDEIDDAVYKCIAESNFIKGRDVGIFENAFSDYIGVKHCLGCANGTDSIEIILKALGIGSGDEVIVPALSWISTAEAVSNIGAEPIFADICEDTYTIDPKQIEAKISRKTKAVIPVHLYGCPASMDEILMIADNHQIFVIEDCAQAHGATFGARKIGSLGVASSFSFFPSKNLGAFGDSGAILTNDSVLFEKVKRIANHGQLHLKHQHSVTGRNSRLDTLQAAVLNVKLKYLDKWNAQRQSLALQYINKLSSNPGVVLPQTPSDRTHVHHLFVIRTKQRNDLCGKFDANGVAWSIHYPAPLPFVDAYAYKGHKMEEFPTACNAVREILSIPLYPEMNNSQLQLICDLISEKI